MQLWDCVPHLLLSTQHLGLIENLAAGVSFFFLYKMGLGMWVAVTLTQQVWFHIKVFELPGELETFAYYYRHVIYIQK
ncbi:hypothetical protein ACJX0J_014172, partial [Zea mays]